MPAMEPGCGQQFIFATRSGRAEGKGIKKVAYESERYADGENMRIIRHDKNRPYVVKLGEVQGLKELLTDERAKGYELHICACGLSKNKPFCDGTHAKTDAEEEGKIYTYGSDGSQAEAAPHYE